MATSSAIPINQASFFINRMLTKEVAILFSPHSFEESTS